MANNNQSLTSAFLVTDKIINILSPITASEQGNNLVYFLGVHQESAGKSLEIPAADDDLLRLKMFAEVGISVSQSNLNFKFIVDGLVSNNLIYSLDQSSPRRLQLTFKGWEKYEELSVAGQNKRKGFMAMKFPPKEEELCSPPHAHLMCLYTEFKQELLKNNYELSNPLLDNQQAGNIDARLEREIREAGFLIADLSHYNAGAYWEAGFAHGLGKKVFYTCHDSVTPHFDANHHTTIFWSEGKEKEAAEKLMATIYNTFTPM